MDNEKIERLEKLYKEFEESLKLVRGLPDWETTHILEDAIMALTLELIFDGAENYIELAKRALALYDPQRTKWYA